MVNNVVKATANTVKNFALDSVKAVAVQGANEGVKVVAKSSPAYMKIGMGVIGCVAVCVVSYNAGYNNCKKHMTPILDDLSARVKKLEKRKS